ncbi:alpha/beta hydrolase-fold protein [Microtetraspora sp. NBRC 16547]|uniref:alpha/beta hydrolase n=1 Tax=Microtetraspora sp. NBRC 16547 TaxID=3030993 RepID=UPI0024A26E13|nr:alpha/beta hydrolase-fold protein [Microtetraspora sp. NBRC 16547]GLW96204.1 esterase [Microtetraspora sp. NBRC 16547]
MELTSITLQMLVAALAVGALVATVWLWPRLSGPSWRSVAGRIGVLIGDQLLMLAALGLALNSYFAFYSSWSDLLGTDTSTAPIVPATAEGASLVQITGSTPVLVPHPGAGHSGGRLEQVVISGPRTGLSAPAYVYLPPQYFQKKFTTARFPVIVALTGYPGDAKNLVTRMNLPERAATLISSHQMRPTIMVLMRPTVAPPRDTECVDVPGGPQAETFLSEDLRHAIAATFRVGTDAQSWGVLGGSTGGYCALKLTMRHPTVFSAAVSLSGYYHALVDVTTGDLFGGNTRLRDEHDLMWRLAHLPAPPVSVLVTSSKQGESNYKATKAFVAAVKPPMQASSLILPSGGHNFATWNRELPQALPWLAQQLHDPGQA